MSLANDSLQVKIPVLEREPTPLAAQILVSINLNDFWICVVDGALNSASN